MQNDKFNELLSQRAKDFVLTPNENVFDAILARKNKQNNKRKSFLFFAAASCFLLASIIAITQYVNHKNTKLTVEKTAIYLPEKLKQNKEKISDYSDNKIQNQNEIPPIKITDKVAKSKSEISHSNTNDKSTFYQKSKIDITKAKPVLANANHNQVLFENKPIISKENSNNLAGELDPITAQNDTSTKENLIEQIVVNTPVKTIDSVEKNVLTLTNNTTKQTHKFGYQFTLFNNYLFLTRAYNGADNETIKNKFGVSYNEQAKQAYSLGMMAGLNKNKFTFSVGFAYNHVEFDEIFKIDYMSNTALKRESFMNDAGYYLNVIDQSLSFIEIPVSVAYKIGNKKWSISAEVGTAIQYLVQTKTYALQNDSLNLFPTSADDATNERFDKVQYLFFSSMLTQYQINKHVLFFAGPTVRMHINQYFKNEFTDRPAAQYVGLSSGIKIIL